MQNRVPVPRDQRPPLPDFAPVPRRHARHDGWTPERQRAFIEALADTGSVSTAARMVNMASEGAYALRRHPQADGFRRAWEAALDMGVQRLKDEAFDRAINGQLVPVFSAGKLMGFNRKKNDRLLMFCLRHYGQDAQGKRITVNYFSANASATSGSSPEPAGGPSAQPVVDGAGSNELPATALPALSHQPETQAHAAATLRTSITAPTSPTLAERDDAAAAALGAFEGIALDAEAQAAILAALTACAERHRTQGEEDNPETPFVPAGSGITTYMGALENPLASDDYVPLPEGERPWQTLGDEAAHTAIEEAVARVHAHQALPEAERLAIEAEWDAEAERQHARNRGLTEDEREERGDWRNWTED